MRSHGALRQLSAAAAIASVLLLAGEARSQGEPESAGIVVPGSKVRLLAPTAVRGQIQGTVTEMDRNWLLLSAGEQRPIRVPREAITRLDVSTGRYGHAVQGTVIGAVFGALYGAAIQPCELASPGQPCPTKGEAVAAGALSFAGLGALIGHLIKSDRWNAVPLEGVHVGLAPLPGRGVGLSVALAVGTQQGASRGLPPERSGQ